MIRRLLVTLFLVACAFAGGAAYMLWKGFGPRFAMPDPPSVVARMKEVARLEALQVNVYKKVSFSPPPQPSGSMVGDVFQWARFTLHPPEGKAIVFATVHVGVDVDALDVSDFGVNSGQAIVRLPPLKAVVELHPGETEVIGSNLDSQQTAQLMDVAKGAFEREVLADPLIRERAEGSVKRALTGLLLEMGYAAVKFEPPKS